MDNINSEKKFRRVKTPTVLQMEAVECGAASLAMVLAYYGKFVTLEELRLETGVSRDGVKASNVVKAARKYGFSAKGFRKEPQELRFIKPPMIVHWNFNHFLVLEGFHKGKAFLNDPAAGCRVVSEEEFDQSFTGVVMVFEKGEDFQKSGNPSSMIQSLKSRLKPSGSALIFIALTGLALVVPGLIIPTFARIFVDYVLVARMEDWVRPLLLGMFLTYSLQISLKGMQKYFLLRLEAKLSLTSSACFIWHILRVPVEFFAQRFTGDITSRIQSNDTVARLISQQLTAAAIDLVMIVFYAGLMFQYDVPLTICGITVAVSNVLFLRYVSRRRVDASRLLQQERGKLFGASLAGLQLIETLKAGGAESDFFMKWSGYQAKLLNSEQKLSQTTQILTAVPGFLTGINSAILLTLGGLRVMDGHLSMGMLVAFQSLMASFMTPVISMVNLGSTLQEVEGDLNRLDDIFRYRLDERYDDQNQKCSDTSNSKLSGYVELRNISFGYSRLEAPLIEDFSLTLKPGQRVALVGGSGSGKSTIAKLVSGLYQPWSGEILFDGIPVNRIPREIFCNSIAMVDQDICMFEGSVRDNLTLWDLTVPEQDMITAAKDACIHEDITGKPGGYSYEMIEGGYNFSGGQRQRIELARSLVSNPTVLILDEATSALDPLTEKAVDSCLRRRGCSCIIVAHRLSTIRDCEEIIVLDRGKAVQRGTHEELIGDEYGLYYELIRTH